MPGSHFSSKRLRKALQTKSDPRMAGTVSRVGTPLATIRLLPRVEKHCGCSVRAPPLITTVTVTIATVGNNNQIVDGNDFWGTSGTTISFVETYDVQVGDTVVFSKTGVIPETTVTVESILSSGTPHNRKFRIITTPSHNISVNVENVTVTIPDNR